MNCDKFDSMSDMVTRAYTIDIVQGFRPLQRPYTSGLLCGINYLKLTDISGCLVSPIIWVQEDWLVQMIWMTLLV
jgi:hypothetical protein